MQPAPLPALRSFPRFALFLSLSICHTRCKGEFTEYAVRRYRFKWVRVKRCQHAEYLAAAKPYKNDEKNRVKKRALIVAKGMQREWAWGWDKVECTALHVAHLSPLSLSFTQRWKIISVHFFCCCVCDETLVMFFCHSHFIRFAFIACYLVTYFSRSLSICAERYYSFVSHNFN